MKSKSQTILDACHLPGWMIDMKEDEAVADIDAMVQNVNLVVLKAKVQDTADLTYLAVAQNIRRFQ